MKIESVKNKDKRNKIKCGSRKTEDGGRKAEFYLLYMSLNSVGKTISNKGSATTNPPMTAIARG